MNVVSRQDALSLGLATYFTGNPCKNGHVSERYTKHRSCIECLRECAAREESKKWMREHNKKRRQSAEFLELERRVRNSEKGKARKSAYNKRPEMLAWRRKWQKERRASDPVFAMRRRFSSLLNIKIRNMGYSKKSCASSILGCDWEAFKRHIEIQFLPGMSWDNRNDWHIDHIVPAASARDEDELTALFHFTNLRPLWAIDNIKKGAKREHLL